MSDNRIAPEILELIRRTSTVGGCRSVYSLAPRGSRVGFYFQQRRATLLAKALLDRLGEPRLKDAKIAVVGAGITGVTFFLSLLHYGAKNVFLYEAADEFLKTGEKAPHRLVHPNYNRWPTLGSMDIFTSLPVLNWFAGTGKDVVAQLRLSIHEDYSEEIKDRFRPGYRCIEVMEKSAEFSDPVRITFEKCGTPYVEDFEIVALSVGFGGEACDTIGLEDYWTIERTPLDVGDHKRDARVFGTGDGALIDILRCCAREPENAWQMPLGLIAQLRADEASVLQEDRALGPVAPRSLEFTEWEIKIQRHEESIRAASWDMVKKADEATTGRYVAHEEDFYRDLVRQIQRKQRSICEFLEGGLKRAAEPRLKPKLIGTLTTPFEPTSAPINKLLLAYLLETDRISYQKNTRAESDAALKKIKRTRRTAVAEKIEICRYGANRNFPSPATRRPKTAVHVYTKGGGRKKKLAETEVERQLIDLLSGLSGGEYVYFDAMPHPLELARNGHDPERLSVSTLKRFKPIIERFACDELDATEVKLVAPKGGFPPKWSINTAMKQEEIKDRLRLLGGIDGVYCGAAIVVTREVQPEMEDF